MQKLAYFFFLAFSSLVISYTIKYFFFDDLSIKSAVRRMLPISQGKWWFLTYYVIIFILSPVIERGIMEISRQTFRKLITILTLIMTCNFLSFVPDSGSSLMGLLYIYLLGRYMALYNLEENYSLKVMLSTYVLCFFTLWGAITFFSTLPGTAGRMAYYVLGYNNPLITIMAVLIFFIIRKVKSTYSRVVNCCCANVLSIYLITEGIGGELYKSFVRLIDNNPFTGNILVVLFVVSCLIVGGVLNYLFAFLSDRLIVKYGEE